MVRKMEPESRQPGTEPDSAKRDVTNLLDVIIIGGGAAGLGAALLFDAGQQRNAPAKIFNGYLSRDGSTPKEFLEISRQQLDRYDTVQLRRAKVATVERGRDRLTTVLESGERFESRTILLATGLVDELPSIENFRQFYGHTAHNCPYCDGWEVRGQPIVVIGGNQDSADLAIELLLWSEDVILCVNGPISYDEKTTSTLERVGIRVITTSVKRLEGTGGDLKGVRFSDDSFLERAALFFSPGQFPKSPLAEQLGCSFCEADCCIECSDETVTGVPGVYAAGNCTKGVQLVIAAVAEGMQAAFAINNDLVEIDAASGALRHAADDVKPASKQDRNAKA